MSDTALRADTDGVFVISGPLTFASAPQLWREGMGLLNGRETVILDLREVTRSDSAGLALLVQWMREARNRHVDIRFRNIPDQMMAIARTCNLQDLLPRE